VRRLLFTTALKASAIKNSAKHSIPNTTDFCNSFNGAAEQSILNLCSKVNFADLGLNDSLVQNSGLNSLYTREHFNSARRRSSIDNTDIQLNFEWAQFFSIFNLEDLLLITSENSRTYHSAYDYLNLTRNVKHEESDLFKIEYKQKNLKNLSVENANQMLLFLQYQPQNILAKDIELFLHHF
jgi:hypothetical protein